MPSVDLASGGTGAAGVLTLWHAGRGGDAPYLVMERIRQLPSDDLGQLLHGPENVLAHDGCHLGPHDTEQVTRLPTARHERVNVCLCASFKNGIPSLKFTWAPKHGGNVLY